MYRKIILGILFSCIACSNDNNRDTFQCEIDAPMTALRLINNPLLDINRDERLGSNINGPSVIAVPDWLPNPLGKFYMYFADHAGDHIKLAYADDPQGPWTLFEPGTLQLEQAKAFRHHIASPDVHVDDESKSIRMYFHGPLQETGKQMTGIAFSKDGINFKAHDEVQGHFYYRVFQYNSQYYAIAKNDNTGFMSLNKAHTGISDWEFGRNFLPKGRHAAIDIDNDTLVIYYSRVFDTPERIVRSAVKLNDNWETWLPGPVEEVLQPEFHYEGITHPIEQSKYGPAINVRQLRDPAIFNHNGRKFLFYAGEGEETINAAELICAQK